MCGPMKKIVIIGAGGFGREVLDVFDALNEVKPTYNVLGFIVDEGYEAPGTIINDKPVLGDMRWFKGKAKEVEAICAVGFPEVRREMVERAKEYDIKFCSIIHPNVVRTKWIEMGDGVVITAGCILTNQVKIGNHVIINLDCTVGHDTRIADYVTLSPSVNVSGNVRIDEGANIGTGVTLIPKVHVGEWSVVGAGAMVLKNVPANTTSFGNPSKTIWTKRPGWHLKKRHR